MQAHLSTIQNVIQRMASNSAGCKTWCVTLVAAMLVLIADKGRPHLGLLAVLPVIIFGVLDVYYLQLEKGFRNSYNAFISKVHAQALEPSDLYSVDPTGDVGERLRTALKSFSVLGFYLPLLVVAVLAVFIVDRDVQQTGAYQVPMSRYQHYRD